MWMNGWEASLEQIDQGTAEDHADRYRALLAGGRARRPFPADCAELPGSDACPIWCESVPAGWYSMFRLGRGRRLRIETPTGRASASVLLWNAIDVSERLNVADSMKIQWRAALGLGDLLYSDMGRPLASLVADSGAGHDALVGAGDAASTRARYGRDDLRNSRDNLRLGASKLGLDRRDVMPCFTFFAPVGVALNGDFRWRDPGPSPGSHVTLRAEMDLLLALSNCPHPLDPHPDYAPGPLELTLWAGPMTPHDDPCRQACEESRRAFETLDAWRAQGDVR